MGRRVPPRRGYQRGKVTIGFILVAILAGFAGFGGGYWFGLQQGIQGEDGPARHELAATIERQAKRIAALEAEKEKALADAEVEIGELTFYHDLPSQSVDPTPAPVADKAEAVAAAPAAATVRARQPTVEAMPAASGDYLLQVASFRNPDDAAKLQDRLAAAGLRAYSKAVDLPQRGRWYRIYLGPYGQREQAERVRAEVLEKFRLDAMIVRASS